MNPNAFPVREDYANYCNNPQFHKLKQLCTPTNMNELLDRRSLYDNITVPAYNRLAQQTLTYPALDPNTSPIISPFNNIIVTLQGQTRFIPTKSMINEFGQYGPSGLNNNTPVFPDQRTSTAPVSHPPGYKCAQFGEPCSSNYSCCHRDSGAYCYKAPGTNQGTCVRNTIVKGCVSNNRCKGLPCNEQPDSVSCASQNCHSSTGPPGNHIPGCTWMGPAAPAQRENYGNSKALKDLDVHVYHSPNCGHCVKLLKMLKDAGETKNVTLKDVTDPKHSAEMKKQKLGAGVPVAVSHVTGKKQVGRPKSLDALVKKLSS